MDSSRCHQVVTSAETLLPKGSHPQMLRGQSFSRFSPGWSPGKGPTADTRSCGSSQAPCVSLISFAWMQCPSVQSHTNTHCLPATPSQVCASYCSPAHQHRVPPPAGCSSSTAPGHGGHLQPGSPGPPGPHLSTLAPRPFLLRQHGDDGGGSGRGSSGPVVGQLVAMLLSLCSTHHFLSVQPPSAR